MWKPQFDDSAAFGLALVIGKFRGHRTAGHNGAVYGHSTFLLKSRLHDDAVVMFDRHAAGKVTGFSVAPQKFVRVAERPGKLPEGWWKYCGVYGPDFIPIVVHEKFGLLYATTENRVDYLLTPVNRHVFAIPVGMYTDEFAVFLCGKDGQPHTLDFANVELERQ